MARADCISRFTTWWREGHPLVSRWTHDDETLELTWVGRACNVYFRHTQWLRWSWWSYIWQPPERWTHAGSFRAWGDLDKWQVRRCRLRGHPNGEIFYSSGFEPDHRCQDCGELIG